jgi:TatD DNase family protein
MGPHYIDSHAHLNAEEFEKDRSQVIQKAFQEGISGILCPAEISDDKNLQITLDLIEHYPNIIAAAGVHPHHAKNFSSSTADIPKKLAAEKKIHAIGEIGLDFFYNFSKPKDQIEAFRQQLNIAQDLGLPVVVHSRNAAQNITEGVEEEGFTRGGVLHCFTENWEFAKKMLDFDFFISFSGILTYPSAHSLREIAKKLPLNKILIETDSPYLTPVPHRGKIKRNEPQYVKEIAKTLAYVKQMDLSDTAQLTSQNFKSLFCV